MYHSKNRTGYNNIDSSDNRGPSSGKSMTTGRNKRRKPGGMCHALRDSGLSNSLAFSRTISENQNKHEGYAHQRYA